MADVRHTLGYTRELWIGGTYNASNQTFSPLLGISVFSVCLLQTNIEKVNIFTGVFLFTGGVGTSNTYYPLGISAAPSSATGSATGLLPDITSSG